MFSWVDLLAKEHLVMKWLLQDVTDVARVHRTHTPHMATAYGVDRLYIPV